MIKIEYGRKGGVKLLRFGKALLKWVLSVVGLCACYYIFGNIGIVFGITLAYVIVYYL